MKLTDSIKAVKPKALKKGQAIGICAPSSQINIQSVSNFVRILRELGYEVVLGDTITTIKDRDYTAGTAKERADDLNAMFKDKGIRAIFAGAGGFGAQKTSHFLDLNAFANDPKPMIGFSDTTFLLNTITVKTGIQTFLGPTAEVVDWEKDKKSLELCLAMISGELNDSFTYENLDGCMTRRISARGKTGVGQLVGGNITMIQTTLGTDFEIDTKGKIVLLEEVGESSYSIERSLDHLFSAGKFEECAGIAFGEFTDIGREPVKNAKDSNPSVYEILVKKFKHAAYPVLLGYNFSHGIYNLTLPIGGTAKIDSTNRTLEIIERLVR
jgi:muramoyltetrapeptide carboxypeptidase